MKVENEKCAEVFRTAPGKFTFYCTYCTEQFEMHYDALDHIETHFSLDENTTTLIKTNNIELNTCLQTEELNPTAENNEKELDANDTKTFLSENNFQSSILDPNDFDVKTEPETIISIKNTQTKVLLLSEQRRRTNSSSCRKWKSWVLILPKTIVECDICGNKVQKCYINKHMQSHAYCKKFACYICQKRFYLKEKLVRHMAIHTGVKRYVCHCCPKQFHELTNLKRHIRIHTGEKPHKCEICGKTFAQSFTLRVHMRTHTEEKPFQCEICNKSFSTSSNFRSHERRHTNERKFKCSVCDKAFESSKDMRRHYSIHTGERPYTCDTCNASFSRKYRYNEHLLLHTNEKPYKCRFCDINFCQMAARRLHERSVHNDIKRVSAVCS